MKHFTKHILEITDAKAIISTEQIQSLWSGYGSIVRVFLEGGKWSSAIIKHIKFPNETNHPRGWNTDVSHQRKVKSYEVESYWYQHWEKKCNDACKAPNYLGYFEVEDEKVLILEDLNEAGFPLRKTSLSVEQSKVVLAWLANFHATFMYTLPKGLWPIGTYWHLATRQDEFQEMEEGQLKEKASDMDKLLNNCNYQTLVHGDAKLANFCFSTDLEKVAAVDFQYVGGGCGMKDVVYFLGSSLSEEECEIAETELLDYYFKELKSALKISKPNINANAVEKEYRSLYAVAWTDFTRFLQGWSPSHKKLNKYSTKLKQQAFKQIHDFNSAAKHVDENTVFTCGIDAKRDDCGDAIEY